MPISKTSQKSFRRLLVICAVSLLILFTSAFYCGASLAANNNYSQLVGIWQGEWRPYETKLLKTVGRLPIRLKLTENAVLSGQIGELSIIPTLPALDHKQIQYRAKLSAPLKLGDGESKDHLIILITQVENEKLAADLHFKSRFGFDFSMHPGELNASKQRD